MPAAHSLAQKVNAVKAVQAFLQQNKSERTACMLAGVPQANFKRWSTAVVLGGESALMPKYKNCGRKPKWELTREEAEELRALVLVHDSQTFAIERFAIASDICRHETHLAIIEEIQKARIEKRWPRWPVSLRRAIATTPEERAKMRGPKHFDALSFSPRKGMFLIDKDGRKVLLHPHTAWTMDDYSTNEPYIVPTLDGGERLCRQVLASMDMASDAWLSVEMIGRERDAYRAEDILRFILRTIDGQGTMPLYLLLERGRWESAAIHGLDLGKSWEAGGLGARYDGRTWGGLDDLFCIIHGYTSRHKAALESSFNMLQRCLAHSGREIGRYRSEFEKATKDMLAVQAGRKDARACGFLTLDDARERHWEAMTYTNNRGKERASTGTVEVPNELLSMWDENMARPLPDSERWRFYPVKRRAVVQKGFVELKQQPYPQSFRFQVNGLSSADDLPTGYTLLVAFDPAAPHEGAYVANGEDGSLNRDNRRIGEFLGVRPYADDVATIDLREGGYGDGSKRRANAAASTAFQSINPFKRGLAVTARHDGRGTASVSRTGARSARDGMTGAVGEEDPLQVALKAARSAPAEAGARDSEEAFPESKDNNSNGSREAKRIDFDALEQAALEKLIPL